MTEPEAEYKWEIRYVDSQTFEEIWSQKTTTPPFVPPIGYVVHINGFYGPVTHGGRVHITDRITVIIITMRPW